MTWIKLKKHNDWEYETYVHQGQKHTFIAGEVVRVRFPDGTEEDLPIVVGRRRASYSDHGHDHDVESPTYGVRVSHRGITHVVDLSKLEVDR